MYWILFLMGGAVSLVVAVLVGGAMTPRAHAVARTVVLRARPESVWTLVRTVGSYADWRPEIQSTLVDGEEWQEFTTGRALRLGVVESEAPRRFIARVLDDDLPFTREWTWQLVPEGEGTRVTLIERGETSNPLYRFVGAHMKGHHGAIDSALNALAVRVGDAAARIEDAGPANGRA